MKNEKFSNKIEKWSKKLTKKLKIEKKSDLTISTYNSTYNFFILFINQYSKKLTFKNIKEDDIYEFLDYKEKSLNIQGNLKEATKDAYITHLKRLFLYIEKNSDEMYDFDKVFQDIKIKKIKREPKGLNQKDLATLELYFKQSLNKKTLTTLRNNLLLKLMLYSGLRISESLNTKFIDIKEIPDEDNLFAIQILGKGSKERVSYIKKEYILEELNDLIKLYDMKENNFIAITKTLKRMTRSQMSKAVEAIFRKLKIINASSHTLRHTYAKQRVEEGVSLPVLQKLLGHSNIEITSIYTNPTDEMIINSLKKV